MDRWDHPLYLKWLSDLPVEAADEVVSAMNYLTEFGRSAQLDLARHRIQTSKHFPHKRLFIIGRGGGCSS
jgi:hypothetical protein